MTPLERKECVGRWADIGSEPVPVVIRGVEVGMVSWVDARHPNRNGFVGVDAVTPRFDLMRAWNPDGTPVVMRQEWAARLESGGASIAHTRAEAEQAHALHREQHENHGTGFYDMLGPPPPAPAGIQHRFTTEWETTDE